MKNFTKMFWVSLAMGVLFVAWGVVAPGQMASVMASLKTNILDQFGWFYQLSVALIFIVSIAIAFSKFGKIKLGSEGDKPEYSTPTWFAMLFSAGMGIGLMFYGASEPMSHYSNPPVGDGGTIEAAKTGLQHTYLHWGFSAWGIYAIVALALAYYQFKKGMPGLMSTTLYPLIGDRVRGPIGKVVDIIAIFATLFGVAISLGIGASQINGGLNYLFGVPNTFNVQLIIMAVTMVLFITSAATGLSKGIKILSNTNLILAVVLLISFLFLGPTQFILELFSTTLGAYLQDFASMSFRFAPFTEENNQWVKDWTIFYWAWWISWTPFVSTFIARVSRGRTVREFIMAVIVAPTLVCVFWFAVFGGGALHLDFVQGADVSSQSLETTLFYVFDQLPLSGLLSTIAVLLIATFFITSADSATFVLGMQTSNGSLNPPFFVKLSWGIIMTAIAAILMGTGGYEGLQAATIISGLPLTVILLLMMVGLIKSFKADVAKKEKRNKKAA
ncbi:choline transporter [Pontibacillus halophilus JSM 076056 = DSM 19796]|uniref:Choline transporter n=1 Tax=Pontibacillus halophilus JSM 076056 = DSM 19796 TaxID=1385510 RepID=A0A0A5GPK4_9BACI|nr:BCCT family transporter [Pontibacillus halophilus]KGX93914.1 choline transporter [Pontibacillus halophilus JSM 076056 = DSM 19796]